MNAPSIASTEFVDAVGVLLLETITIQQDTGSLTPPAGSPSWSDLHASVSASVEPMTTDETRDEAHTVAATAYTVVADGWLSDVSASSAYRVQYGGGNYDILGVNRVGNLNLTRLVIERRVS